jgi:hypothetical protein
VQRAGAGQRAAGDPQPERSGRDYLLARAREHRRAERAARELHAPLAALAFDSRMREAPAAPAVLNASYLVDAARAGDFRARIDELAAAQDDLRVLVTGPWPPYSFAPEGRA